VVLVDTEEFNMRKINRAVVVFLLLLTLLVLTFGQVFAIPNPVKTSSSFNDPVVTSLLAGTVYTSEVVGIAYLKGAVQNANQLMAPVGRTDEQFGSNGLVISDLKGKDKVKACFNFPGYNFKWSGSVFKWNGTKWVKQTTTFTTDPSATSYACASGLGNGTYALIIYYWGPKENLTAPTPALIG
jgi:hypothetical protein